jgi:MscS family membrane protein
MNGESQMRTSLAVVFALFCLAPANAQPTQPATAIPPLQPSDTSSPAATLNSFINSCNELFQLIGSGAVANEQDSEVLPAKERILDCLDLSQLPAEISGSAGLESALFLKEVLDRIDLPATTEIPAEEDTDAESNATTSWRIPSTRIRIARIDAPGEQADYRFTAESVRRAAEYYRMIRPLPYRSTGPEVSPGLHDGYVEATKKQPNVSADTSSPRGTLTQFLDACNELHEAIVQVRHFDRSNPEFDRVAQRIITCLDTSQLPDYSREYFDAEAAVCLKEVLDRVSLPPPEQIPGIESIDATPGGEALTRWQVPSTQITIARMQEGRRRGEFLFTAGTVAAAPSLFAKVRGQPYRTEGRAVSQGFYDWWLSSPGHPTVAAIVDRLPGWANNRLLGLAVWQWAGLAVGTILSLAIMGMLIIWSRPRVEKIPSRSLLTPWLGFGLLLIAAGIPILFKQFAWVYLSIRGTPIYAVNFASDIVFLLCIVGLVVNGCRRTAETVISFRRESPGGLDASLTRIISRVLGIVLAAVVFLEGGRYLGFPVTTLIASAGIGGLALALSAQGVIKGLFGTVTVLMDKPYRVGERIKVNGHEGVVEDIGLRSTKIRALNNHVICLPNDMLADAEIENIGKREHICRMSDLHIPLDTPREHIEQALAAIRTILADHEGMDPDFPPRVFFDEFNSDSFNIRIIYWYAPPDLWQYYAFCEQVNLKIFEAFERRGIQFSLPLRHSYWKHDDRQGPLEVALRSQE